MEARGKAIVFGDDVNTDLIIPGKYLTTLDPEEMGRHAMEGLDPNFAKKAKSGVVIVAGKNFGCGSSREQAPIALEYAGVKCILAESFARIFYRNAINIGLPVLECPSISNRVDPEDELLVDIAEGKIADMTRNESFQAFKLPIFILDILQDGGLIENLKKRLKMDGRL